MATNVTSGNFFRFTIVGFVLTGVLTACSHSLSPNDATLYQRLGATEGITIIVDNLLFHIADDELIVHLFEDTDLDRFREKLIEQLCEISDGPCRYSGDSMEQSHQGLDISHGQFNSLVEDLILAMQDAGIDTGAQNLLLARLAPMYERIVHR